jgi:PIN domain nuclease of toxin-antitoxin system
VDRLTLPESPARFVPAERERHGIDALPLDEESALHLARLPPAPRSVRSHARLPGLVHGLTILGPDPLLSQYPVRMTW